MSDNDNASMTIDLTKRRKLLDTEVPFSLRNWGWQNDIRCSRSVDEEAHVDIPWRYWFHSPTGMEFGYAGSGPADLALNILALWLPLYYAWKWHQKFKFAFVSVLPREGGVIPRKDVLEWIELQRIADALPESTITPDEQLRDRGHPMPGVPTRLEE